MAIKNTIRVAEYEKLYFDNNKPFKQKHWQALCQYREKNNIDYFRIINNGIQFTNYVGVIQAGNLTIEILPKTDKHRITAANMLHGELEIEDMQKRQSWHDVLLQMLKECAFLKVRHVDYASLNLKSNSILDIYIELFLVETEKLLHEGLTKKYRKVEGNMMAIKGQLLFEKNVVHNLVHGERFYVRHTEYNSINIFNQLLYKTLCLIPSLSTNYLLVDRINRLLLNFPEMPDIFVTTSTYDNLIYDRKTERYKEALLISKLLLLNYRPNISRGSENVMAILFDMNLLWEEFIYRRLIKAAGREITILRQNTKPFWFNLEHDYYKKLKPDIIIQKNNRIIVLDTKWKIPNDRRPSDADLKQMFVYNLWWNADTALLLYPGKFEECKGSYRHFSLSESWKKKEDEEFFNHCSMVFLDVFDEKGKLVGNEPFAALLNSLETDKGDQ